MYAPVGKLKRATWPCLLFLTVTARCCAELGVEVLHQTLLANGFCMASALKSLAASTHEPLCLFSVDVESE